MSKLRTNGNQDKLTKLFTAIGALENTDEVKQFLVDLCTPAELTAMADRWQVVSEIIAEKPYRQIYDETGVSITTVGRVARCISYGTGGYQMIHQRLRGQDE